MNNPSLFLTFDESKAWKTAWRNNGTNVPVGDVVSLKIQTLTYAHIQMPENLISNIPKEFGVEVGWLIGLLTTKKICCINDTFISVWAKIDHISKKVSLSFEIDANILHDTKHIKPNIKMEGTFSVCPYKSQNKYEWGHFVQSDGVIESARGTFVFDNDDDDGDDLIQLMHDELLQAFTTNDWTALLASMQMEIKWEKCIRQSPYNISNITTSQFTDDSFKDLIVAVEDGTEFRCHKSIIAAQSTALAVMINPKTGMEESVNSRIQLLGIGKEAFGVLLPYLYGSGISVSKLDPPSLVELLLFAHQYDLRELEAQLKSVIEEKSQDLFPLETILNLYYFSSNAHGFERIKNQALGMISNVRVEVENCELFNGLSNCEQNKLKTAVDDYQQNKERETRNNSQ